MRDLAGKTVLITGASGAVGQACLEAFLQSGAKVLLTDRVWPPSVLADDRVHFECADVTDREAVNATFDAALRHLGHIDILVLAAGVEGVVASVEDITEANLDAVLAVNLKGSLFWLQSGLRHMKPRGSGAIVALSSISGVVGSASMAAYAISKHAVLGLVRSAALEAAGYGVRVNAVCPGPIDSEMMRRIDDALGLQNPQRVGGRSGAAKALPQQRYVSAAEVAAMVAFLCSDDAASCNGGAYMVDGGFTAR